MSIQINKLNALAAGSALKPVPAILLRKILMEKHL